MTPMLEAAIGYASRNLSVFPCEKKIPLTGTGGFKNASLDAKQLIDWWTKNPNAQIGLPTGQVNHLFVVDVDGPQGDAAVSKMCLPETFTVETRPGRKQLWFSQPDGVSTKNSASAIAPQLDIRGDGGYVIAPPSVHHETGKPYRVIKDVPWAPAPPELMNPARNSPAQAAPTTDAIPKGRRHQTLLSLAGSMRARGLSPETIFAQLKISNEKLCVPPIEEADLRRISQYLAVKPTGFPGEHRAEVSAEIDIETFFDLTPEPLVWLWPGKIPLGKLTIFAGMPGFGKSLTSIDLAATLSRGDKLPDGAGTQVADTLFLSAEDDAKDTILPRLIAANADTRRIHRVNAVKVILADGQTAESVFNFERDIEKLDAALARFPNVRLLVVDPVSAYMGAVDTHRDAEIRRVLSPLAQLAAERKVAVAGIMHLKKSETTALLRVSGSIGFVAAARVVWGIGPDPEDAERRIMVPIKNNLAPLGTGLAFRIETNPASAPRIVWEPDAITLSADEVLSTEVRDGQRHEGRSMRSEAIDWLRAQLDDGAQPVSALEKQAKSDGFSWRTIQRAKERLRVRAYKISVAGGWAWELER